MRECLVAMAALVLALPLLDAWPTATANAKDPTASRMEAGAEYLPRPSASEENIASVLDKPADFNLIDERLDGFVDELNDKSGINVQLDVKALHDAGLSRDTSITCRMKSTSLRSALRVSLSKFGLTFFIKDGVLMITTKDVASSSENLATRIYPVGDLVGRGDYSSLMDLITEVIDKNTWDENGGEGKIEPHRLSGCLIISQTDEIQAKVLEVLRALRAARKMVGTSEESNWAPTMSRHRAQVGSGMM
jgi:hypothetical protein